MTLAHLVFAIATTGYILVAIQLKSEISFAPTRNTRTTVAACP